MRMRIRKLFGTVALLALVIFWPLLMLALGHSKLSLFYAPAQLVFFFLFGLIWLLPAGLLIRWMQRPDPPRENRAQAASALQPSSDTANGTPDIRTSR
jgi:hypothetical protein